ncbi:MAG: DUF3857 domain-containing protein [Bacteroidetes bacterium]|nr:DUF3857 domain-containing protein [Bacteroidota bacterium]
MKYNFFVIIFLLPFYVMSQDYNVALIPDSLKEGANVVTRYEERVYEIKSPGKAIEHERHVYTILNESADYLGKYKTYYGDFSKIKYVSGTLYDASGKKIKHFKTSDMSDYSVQSDMNFVSNERFKTYDFYNRVYPYTVDFEEEDEINGILDIDDWTPQGINRAAVQHTKYMIIAPADYVLRYKPINCSLLPVITQEKEKKIYTWELQNLTSKTPEVLAPYPREIIPYVAIAPSQFEAQGYRGDMSTWLDYGKFIYQLVKGRDVLPEETKRKVHELTDNLKDPLQKTKVLYEYLQKNSHYISIQLGIGGWQPFDASYVANKKYGDCKALSNFMIALLKEAGVEAKYVEIYAGEDAPKMIEDFTFSQFNHVTCCVPINKDTIWLECTNQSKAFGYAGSFTGNRKALLIDGNGGHIVQTPTYTFADNMESRKITAELSLEGHLTLTSNTQYRAEKQDLLSMEINSRTNSDMMDRLKSEIDLPTYDVQKFDYREEKSLIPSVYESLTINAPNYAQVTGKRLFVAPNILNRSNERLKPDSNRKYPIDIKESYTEIDSVEIKIPSGFELEAAPQDNKLETQFGKFYSSVKLLSDKLVYYRYRVQYRKRFPATEYEKLANYFEQIYKADHAKLVLVKRE